MAELLPPLFNYTSNNRGNSISQMDGVVIRTAKGRVIQTVTLKEKLIYKTYYRQRINVDSSVVMRPEKKPQKYGTPKLQFPHNIRFTFSQKKPAFFIGGPKIGWGSNRVDKELIMRYGWECGIEHRAVDYVFALDYDTNYHGYNTLSFTSSVFAPWFSFPTLIPNIGFGVGATYNFEIEEPAFRIMHQYNYSILGFSASYDYYPHNETWKTTVLGQITF